jgi:hypothetical protein
MDELREGEASDLSKCTFTEDGKLEVWLVFVWVPPMGNREGYFYLRSVSLTEKHARYAEASAKNEIYGTKVYVEKNLAEHIYGHSMMRKIGGYGPPNDENREGEKET